MDIKGIYKTIQVKETAKFNKDLHYTGICAGCGSLLATDIAFTDGLTLASMSPMFDDINCKCQVCSNQPADMVMLIDSKLFIGGTL